MTRPHTRIDTRAAHPIIQYLPFTTTIVLLSGALILTACSTPAGAGGTTVIDTRIPVRVTTLAGAAPSRGSEITATGTVAGKEEVALSFKIGGVIARIAVQPGESVRAGQELAALRPTEVDAQVASALEARRKAERDLARVTRLFADSVATLEQLQDARTGLEVAGNAARIAQFNSEFAVIRAPGDGVVLERMAEPGQVVEPGRSVLVVRRSGRGMVVRLGLSDRDALRVAVGDEARVSFDAMPGTSFTARVSQRAARATTGSGDFAVELALPDAANALPTGLVARVTLQPRRGVVAGATPRVFVPLDALVDADADSAAVFVLRADGNTVSRRSLKLADVTEALQTASVPVVAGLDGTETIVTVGMSRLLDGTKVRVTATPAQRASADAAPAWRVGQ